MLIIYREWVCPVAFILYDFVAFDCWMMSRREENQVRGCKVQEGKAFGTI